MAAPRPPQTMVLQLKGQKIRFNADAATTGGHGGAGIIDLKDKKMITMIDPPKKYLEMDMNSASQAAMAHGGAPTPPPGA